MNSGTIQLFTVIIGTVLGILTLIKAVFEYSRQNTQKRLEYYISLRRQFDDNESMKKILQCFGENDEDFLKIPYEDKRVFLGFYEDLALIVNSGLIKASLAYYMFGYYAIRCWDSKNFWKGESPDKMVNKEALQWRLFKEFCEKMKELDEKERHIIKSKYKV